MSAALAAPALSWPTTARNPLAAQFTSEAARITDPVRWTLLNAIDNTRRMRNAVVRHLNRPVPWIVGDPDAYRAELRAEIAKHDATLTNQHADLAVWDRMTPDQRLGVSVFNPGEFA